MDEKKKNEVEACICSVLTSNPLRMTIKDLDREYRETVGQGIPFRALGYHNLEQYLHSIPHRVVIKGNGYYAEVRLVVSEKSAHINELICKQRVAKTRKSQIYGLRKSVTINPEGPQAGKAKVNFTNSRSPLTPRTPLCTNVQRTPPPYGIECQSSPIQPKLSPAVPSLLSPPRVPPPHLEFHPAMSPPSPASQRSSGAIPKHTKQCPIPIYIKDRLRQIIAKYPEGLLCNQLPDLYKNQFKHNLNFYDYGYKSIALLCMDLKCTFTHQRLKDGNVKVFDKNLGIHVEHEPLEQVKIQWNVSHRNTEPALPDDVEPILLDFHLKHLAKDIVTNANIIRQWIGADVGIADYIDLLVTEMYDPSKFWIQLRQYSDKLDQLMDQMQIFYRNKKDLYNVPSYAINNEMYLVCLFDGEYHRAKVIDSANKRKGTIKVYYIDYGTVAVIRTQGVCYLVKPFVSLPAQAIKARLYGIKPCIRDSPWPPEAAGRFLQMVRNKELVGEICEIDENEMILDLIVSDTTTPGKDFFVNDALIHEEYAVFSNEDGQISIMLEYEATISNVYLYPTHEEFETGRVPTYEALLHMVACNMSYDRILPQYFHKKDSLNRSDATDSWADKLEIEEESRSLEISAVESEVEVEKEMDVENEVEQETNNTDEVEEEKNKMLEVENKIDDENKIVEMENKIEVLDYDTKKLNEDVSVIVTEPDEEHPARIAPYVRPPPGFHVNPGISPNNNKNYMPVHPPTVANVLANSMYYANVMANQAILHTMAMMNPYEQSHYPPPPPPPAHYNMLYPMNPYQAPPPYSRSYYLPPTMYNSHVQRHWSSGHNFIQEFQQSYNHEPFEMQPNQQPLPSDYQGFYNPTLAQPKCSNDLEGYPLVSFMNTDRSAVSTTANNEAEIPQYGLSRHPQGNFLAGDPTIQQGLYTESQSNFFNASINPELESLTAWAITQESKNCNFAETSREMDVYLNNEKLRRPLVKPEGVQYENEEMNLNNQGTNFLKQYNKALISQKISSAKVAPDKLRRPLANKFSLENQQIDIHRTDLNIHGETVVNTKNKVMTENGMIASETPQYTVAKKTDFVNYDLKEEFSAPTTETKENIFPCNKLSYPQTKNQEIKFGDQGIKAMVPEELPYHPSKIQETHNLMSTERLQCSISEVQNVLRENEGVNSVRKLLNLLSKGQDTKLENQKTSPQTELAIENRLPVDFEIQAAVSNETKVTPGNMVWERELLHSLSKWQDTNLKNRELNSQQLQTGSVTENQENGAMSTKSETIVGDNLLFQKLRYPTSECGKQDSNKQQTNFVTEDQQTTENVAMSTESKVIVENNMSIEKLLCPLSEIQQTKFENQESQLENQQTDSVKQNQKNRQTEIENLDSNSKNQQPDCITENQQENNIEKSKTIDNNPLFENATESQETEVETPNSSQENQHPDFVTQNQPENNIRNTETIAKEYTIENDMVFDKFPHLEHQKSIPVNPKTDSVTQNLCNQQPSESYKQGDFTTETVGERSMSPEKFEYQKTNTQFDSVEDNNKNQEKFEQLEPELENNLTVISDFFDTLKVKPVEHQEIKSDSFKTTSENCEITLDNNLKIQEEEISLNTEISSDENDTSPEHETITSTVFLTIHEKNTFLICPRELKNEADTSEACDRKSNEIEIPILCDNLESPTVRLTSKSDDLKITTLNPHNKYEIELLNDLTDNNESDESSNLGLISTMTICNNNMTADNELSIINTGTENTPADIFRSTIELNIRDNDDVLESKFDTAAEILENTRESRVNLECIDGTDIHIITMCDDKEYLMLQEVSDILLESLPSDVIRRKIARSPYLVDIDDVLLEDDADLKDELMRRTLISDSVCKIDIVPIAHFSELIKALKGDVPSQKCDDFLKVLDKFCNIRS